MISSDLSPCFAGRLVAAVVAVGCCAAAGAQELNQRMWLHLGAFRPHIDSVFQIDSARSAALLGTRIHGESDLGWADSDTVGSLLLGARLRDRWRVEFEYFQLDRSADSPMRGRDITVGETSFSLAAQLSSEFASRVYRLTAGYSFLRLPRAEAGAALGLHVTDFSIALEGTGMVDGVTVLRRREQRKELLPLPTAGLYGSWAFADDWVVQARFDWFSLTYDGYEGTLWNVQANLLYRLWPNVAVGFGYRLNDYELKADRSSWRGQVDYRFHGPQILLEAGF
jgi:hypothetical protein